MKCPKCRTDNPKTAHFCLECGTPFPGEASSGAGGVRGEHVPGSKEAGPKHGDLKSLPSVTKTLETTTDELARGTAFAGRYEIIEELGAGGMGRVYRVFDKKIEEEVALKLIRPEIAAERRTVERFRNEIKTARKITHKNVCRTHDMGEEGKNLFITMEYVRGEDLKSLVRRTRALTVGTAVSIARQMAEGLGEAHRLGVVHRDLKPGNIMIDRDGSAKIMDFGIARSLAGGGTTAEGAVIGTPEYMSPEQVEGKPADERADIYALGAILFEMVTGRPPFEGDTALAVAHKHKYEPAPDPRELNPQLPVALGRLILRSMDKERDKRYQTTGELIADLEAIEAALPATEQAPARGPSTGRKPATSKTITVKITPRKLVIPAAALALFAAVLLLWRPGPRGETLPAFPSDRPSIAILYFSNNTGDPGLDHWRSALAGLLIDKLSQSKHIAVLSKERLHYLLKEHNLAEANAYSSQDLSKLASRSIGGTILLGSLYRSGEQFQVNVTLQKAETGEVVGNEQERGEGETSFFHIVDSLASKIMGYFPLTAAQRADEADISIGEMTSSPEAYVYFAQGEKSYFDFIYPEAISLLEKAVEIDPHFAMAHRHLSALHYNRGQDDKGEQYMRRAFESTQRLSPGDRNGRRIQAEYVWRIERDAQRALEMINDLLSNHPEDLLGNRIKSNLLNHFGELGKAEEVSGTNVRHNPESAVDRSNYSWSLIWGGRLDEAEKTIRDFLENQNENVAHRRLLPVIYAHRGQYDLALAELDKVFKLDPIRFSLARLTHNRGIIHLVRGDLEKARQEFERLLTSDDPESRSRGLTGMVCLGLLQGKFRKCLELLEKERETAKKAGDKPHEASSLVWTGEIALISLGRPESALKEIDEAWRIDAVNWRLGGKLRVLLCKGWALARLGRIQEADQVAFEMEALLRARGALGRYHLLSGLIEVERGQMDKAVEKLRLATSLYDLYTESFEVNYRPLFVDALAAALEKAGDLEGAVERYEEIAGLTLGRYPYCDIYARSFYRLGRLYEDLGIRSKALANYRRFLELWKDADPDLPEIEDARVRLARL